MRNLQVFCVGILLPCSQPYSAAVQAFAMQYVDIVLIPFPPEIRSRSRAFLSAFYRRRAAETDEVVHHCCNMIVIY